MAITLTRNLRLRIDSNLTANAKYNLERLDLLGAAFRLDTTDTLQIQSRNNIVLEPQAQATGGSGVGGTISMGTADHPLAAISFFADAVNFDAPLGLKDSAGNFSLALQYTSTLDGAADVADRVLSLDVNGANRQLILGGNLSLLGGNLQLTASGATALTLPSSGTLATLAGAESLSNKTLVSPTLSGILSGGTLSGVAISGLTNTLSNLQISQGGTGATTALGARTNLLPAQLGNGGKVLSTDGSDVSWVSPSAGAVSSFDDTWSSGLTKVVTHGLGTDKVIVSIKDENNDFIGVDIDVTDINNITLTSSELPTGTWVITVHGAS